MYKENFPAGPNPSQENPSNMNQLASSFQTKCCFHPQLSGWAIATSSLPTHIKLLVQRQISLNYCIWRYLVYCQILKAPTCTEAFNFSCQFWICDFVQFCSTNVKETSHRRIFIVLWIFQHIEKWKYGCSILRTHNSLKSFLKTEGSCLHLNIRHILLLVQSCMPTPI